MEQRREFVESRAGRATRGHDIEIGIAGARLDRIEVEILQHLRLGQFADTRNIAAARVLIDIRQEPMRRGVGRIDGQGLRRLRHAKLREAEVVIGPSQTGTARRTIFIQQQTATIHRAVIVQHHRLLQVCERFDGTVLGLFADAVIQERGGIERIQGFRDIELLRIQGRTPFLEYACPDRISATLGWNRGRLRLPIPAAPLQLAAADIGQAHFQARQWVGWAEFNSALKRPSGISVAVFRRRGKALYQLCASKIRCERYALGRRRAGLLFLTKHQLDFTQPRHASASSGSFLTAVSKVSRAASMRKSACCA